MRPLDCGQQAIIRHETTVGQTTPRHFSKESIRHGPKEIPETIEEAGAKTGQNSGQACRKDHSAQVETGQDTARFKDVREEEACGQDPEDRQTSEESAGKSVQGPGSQARPTEEADIRQEDSLRQEGGCPEDHGAAEATGGRGPGTGNPVP